MSINTSKKIKRVSYNQTDIPSGVDVSNVTATRDDTLLGKRIVDSNGNIHTGTIQTYTGVASRTSNGTFATANKYVTSDLTVNMNSADYIYRHLNPTIIRIDLRAITSTTSITIKIKQASSGAKAFTMNWGDGTQETISTSTSTQTKTHSYSVPGIYSIAFSPTNQNDNRFLLTNSDETKEILTFDSYMFGQSSGSHFTYPVSIYCGDSTWFGGNSLSYCDYIEVLDFTKMNSLLERSSSGSIESAYFTQDFLASDLCRFSTIWTLIIGNGINELKSGCFNNSVAWDIIIVDARGTGKSTAPITITSSSLPTTIYNKIHINHLRLSTYQNATNWSAKSSYMIGY